MSIACKKFRTGDKENKGDDQNDDSPCSSIRSVVVTLHNFQRNIFCCDGFCKIEFSSFNYEAAEQQRSQNQVIIHNQNLKFQNFNRVNKNESAHVCIQGPEANLSDLIAKVEKIVENAQNLNLFSTPLGFVFTGLLSVMVGIFGFYAMYCQFFEASAGHIDISILFFDVEESIRFVNNPDLFTPCLDTFESSCVAPWAYAILYGIFAVYLILNGLFRVLLNIGLVWRRQQVGRKPSLIAR